MVNEPQEIKGAVQLTATHWCPQCDRGLVVRAGSCRRADGRVVLNGRLPARVVVDAISGQQVSRCAGCAWRIAIPQLITVNPSLGDVSRTAAETLSTYHRQAGAGKERAETPKARTAVSEDVAAIRNRFIGARERWLTAYINALADGTKYGVVSEAFIEREFQTNRRAIDQAKTQPDAWWRRRAHLNPDRDNWFNPLPGDAPPACVDCGEILSANRLQVLGWVDGAGTPPQCAACDPRTADRAPVAA